MRTAQLFVTCLVDTFFPEVGEATVAVLRRAGAEVDFPRDQTCCGQPPFNAGLRAEARRIAEHTIRVFERPPRSLETSEVLPDVVLPSGSCAHMIRHNYEELFAGDPLWLPRAKALAARTYEFTEYLVDILGAADPSTSSPFVPRTPAARRCETAGQRFSAHWDGLLTYHPTCHLHRGLGIDRQPRALLSQVRGAELRELPEAEDCCGFGGIFSVEHPELSAEMLKRKIANLEKTQSPTLVVCDAGCLMHIQGGLQRDKRPQKVVHIAEVLDHR